MNTIGKGIRRYKGLSPSDLLPSFRRLTTSFWPSSRATEKLDLFMRYSDVLEHVSSEYVSMIIRWSRR